LWPDNSREDYQKKARDCVICYGREAGNSNIVIFTGGLGTNADHELFKAVADHTRGEYFRSQRKGLG